MMPPMAQALREGLYEHLITEEIERALAELGSPLTGETRDLDPADGYAALARHLGGELRRAFRALPEEERIEAARELVNLVLQQVADLRGLRRSESQETLRQRVAAPARQLLSVHRGTVVPLRPSTPLSTSTLLTRNPAEPALGHALGREIESADQIDALIAFVTVGGVRAIAGSLDRFARRGAGGLRLLTTVYAGTTEIAALEQLARLPRTQIKISFNVQRSRLHAKAWLFHRGSGLSTAYIGSANLSATALGAGQEWMLKASAADLPDVIDKFQGTFETLWQDVEFEPYRPEDEAQRERLAQALRAQSSGGAEVPLTLFRLRAEPFQEEILDRLAAERSLHGRRRNLVVAATGTGKTVIAALDYARVAAARGARPRLLYLAHRLEILQQARDTFRHALQEPAFGEVVGERTALRQEDFVFSTILGARRLLSTLPPEHFQHVIVDECHRAPAASYQALLEGIRPELLVGLTATPERMDGDSLLPFFDGHIAAELRLWHALDRQLLVPFEYYGIADDVDLRRVRWTRQGYDERDLEAVYTGNDARAAKICQQLARRVADLRSVRALGFCVSVKHAEFMAARFVAAGVPALAVHGDTPQEVRSDAPRRLRLREINVIFTCDLYNEGVDLPFVDTLLLLRPTMSTTLFLQQLGRGLRQHRDDRDKTSCLVLDFIGQHREEFRFDAVLSAFTGVPRRRLRQAVEEDFPFLPSGCTLQLDAVARDTILDSLRNSIAGARQMVRDLGELARALSRPPTLREFLTETGRELEEVYSGRRSWSDLRELAALPTAADAEGRAWARRLHLLLHVDEPERLRTYQRVSQSARARSAAVSPGASVARAGAPALSAQEERRLNMLYAQVGHQGVMPACEETVAYLSAHPAAAAELEELCEVLSDRVALAQGLYPVPDWPLALHRHYEQREILAAVAYLKPGRKVSHIQAGVLMLKDPPRELLLVTLDKSARSFSPTTRYRDYAISRELFHWESQGRTSVHGTGRRYIEPGEQTFYLFVRTDPEAAYAFLGPVEYLSHSGDRPIAITWRLRYPMPAALFEQYATLASG